MNIYRLAAGFTTRITWHGNASGKRLYLTFDDGPTPDITAWILDLLDQYEARATFFCMGRNVEQYPRPYREILNGSHTVGNHTYSHPRGLITPNKSYFEDVRKAAGWIRSDLFRPPHGSLRFSQLRTLARDYRIIMWDVLSRDYDPKQNARTILGRLIHNTRPGSIVVFHDSLQAEKKMKTVLPQFLRHFHNEGYIFASLLYP